MGAINSAFNQAVGAVAGAALAIKHAKETDESKMNTAEHAALVARNQARDADAVSNEALNESLREGGLIEKWSAAQLNRENAEKAYNEAVNTKSVSPSKRFEKFTELEAAREAERQLEMKYKAVTDIHNRAEEQRAYADKANKLAERAQQKYKSKWEWGGK